jgi:hypothetical protein
VFFDPLDIPDDLLVAQEEGRLVIFAGAGTSMGAPANLPSFHGLAKQIASGTAFADGIDRQADKLDGFLGDLARNGVEVQKLCREIIGNPASKPNELHRALVDLFLDPADIRIVTTNFDPHFPTVLDERGILADQYCAPALPLGHDFRGLVYLHGGLRRPEQLVLTDEDFGRAYLSEGWAREFLQRLFAKFTILFVGYSHTDVPVQYLARGMSARSMAPRYALAAVGDTSLWATLGVKTITFERTTGVNPYENLYKGISKWAQFSQQQPTDIAARVREIVCSPEQIKPDKAQSSLLKRCLERKDSRHFFTQHAKGWRWVEWVDEQGLLEPLFDPAIEKLSPPQTDLAYWLGPALLAEQSANGLLLVDKYRGNPGKPLWSAVCRGLWHDNKLDWNAPLTQKWLLLLIATCPTASMSQLSALFPDVAKRSLRTLGLVMLRRLLALRVVPKKAMDFSALIAGGETVEVAEKAEFEIMFVCETHSVERAWDEFFKPEVGELYEELLTLFEDRLREAHKIWCSGGRADSSYDPCTFRGRIYDRNVYRGAHGVSLIVDFMLDVMEGVSAKGFDLPFDRMRGWMLSGVPTLVRLGLYGLYRSNVTPPAAKIRFLQSHGLIFPSVYGAAHESRLILTEYYQHLTEPEKQLLWQAVNSGPPDTLREGQTPAQTAERAEMRQYQVDKLVWQLGTKNPTCGIAAAALTHLKQRNPDFVGYEGMDQVMFGGGNHSDEGPRSPKSASDLLGKPVGSQLDFLLSYTGGTAPFQESREGLLQAIRVASGQNQAWALALLKELDTRQQWKSDLWEAAFLGMRLSSLPQADLHWLLGTLEGHFAETPGLRGLTDFLFFQVDLSEGKEPSEPNLDLMIRLSLHIWEQIRGLEPARTEKFEETEWLNAAVNHTAGHIVEFWMKLCGRSVRLAGGQATGIPDWLKAPLDDIVAGKSYAAQLGLAVLGERLAFLQFLDPSFVRRNYFPGTGLLNSATRRFYFGSPMFVTAGCRGI